MPVLSIAYVVFICGVKALVQMQLLVHKLIRKASSAGEEFCSSSIEPNTIYGGNLR